MQSKPKLPTPNRCDTATGCARICWVARILHDRRHPVKIRHSMPTMLKASLAGFKPVKMTRVGSKRRAAASTMLRESNPWSHALMIMIRHHLVALLGIVAIRWRTRTTRPVTIPTPSCHSRTSPTRTSLPLFHVQIEVRSNGTPALLHSVWIGRPKFKSPFPNP